MIYEKKDDALYTWLTPGVSVYEIIEGKHAGKLVEVTALRYPHDQDGDGVPDFYYLKKQARRVDESGNTVKVGSVNLAIPEQRPGISHDAIANGADPVEWVVSHIDDAIQRVLNMESTVGAFAFLPTV